MESATCCGMELARSAVWNHHEVMHGIKPQVDARWRVMIYSPKGADDMHRTSRGDVRSEATE